MEKTSSEILLEAADMLEIQDNWSKGSLFNLHTDPEEGCKMCAHGAIAYCGNPWIKEKVLTNDPTNILRAREEARAKDFSFNEGNQAYIYYKKFASLENLSIEQYVTKHCGQVGLAHCKARLVGLGFSYNDLPSTTKQDVINKLREAAALSIDG